MIGLAGLAAVLTMAAKPVLDVQFPKPGVFAVRVNGAQVFEAQVTGGGSTKISDLIHVQVVNEPLVPMFLGYPHGPKTADWIPPDTDKYKLVVSFDKPVAIEGAVSTEVDDAMPCSDRPDDPLSVSFGPVASTLDNCIYARSGDWLLTTDSERA